MTKITNETEINNISYTTVKKILCLKGQTESIHSNSQILLKGFVKIK